jgi:hypothetical protein
MQCPACGEEVRTVTTPTGARVTINARSEHGRGPNRYMVEPEDAGRARPVSPGFEGSAHSDHAIACEGK